MPTASTRLEPKAQVEISLAPHAHHWRIDEQGGASSAGRCQCGKVRAFQNGWDGDNGFRLSGGGWLGSRDREARVSR